MSFQFPQSAPAPEPKNSGINGVLIGLIIVLLIAVLAVGGWLVYTLTSSTSISDAQDSHKASSASSHSKDKDKAKSKDKKSSNKDKNDNKDKKDSNAADKAVGTTQDTTKPADNYILVDTPSRNISCEIYDDRIGCSIAQRKYSELGLSDCSDRLYSIVVDTTGVRNACGNEFLGSIGDSVRHMDYGESVYSPNGKFQCSLAEDGMSCRNVESRRGFKIARETQNKF